MTYTNHPYSSVTTKNLDFPFVKDSVDKLAENITKGKSVFNYSNQVLRVVPADIIRYVSQSKALNSNDVYRNSIINFVLSCERNCAGSGLIFLFLLSGKFKLSGNNKLRLDQQDLKNVINLYLGSGLISKEVLSLFYNCGFEYAVKYGEHYSSGIKINLTTTEKISGFVDPLFYDIKIDDSCILVCVDGAIEGLGEIDPLLQWSIQNNKKVVLLARRFNPDISSTLRANWDSGSMFVLPYVIDDEGLNVAKLITKEVISIETGLRLSNADFDSYDLAAVNRNKEGCIHVSQNSANSNNLKVDILLPNRLKTIHALLEERMRFGIALTKNCLLKGTSKIWYKEEAYVVPAVCLEYATRALKEWKKIENISCIVTLEQKNVY